MATALGFRTHTGWAVMCVVRSGKPPTLVARTRVQLCPASVPANVYHVAAEDREHLDKAEKLIGRVVDASVKGARASIRGAADDVVAVALVARAAGPARAGPHPRVTRSSIRPRASCTAK